MGTANQQLLARRPRPPEGMVTLGGLVEPDRCEPADDLTDWLRTQYLSEEGALFSPHHGHLHQASIGCLWTTAEFKRQGRRIVGFAEMPDQTYGRLNKFVKARAMQQLLEWFGDIPDFLLTFDAVHAEQTDDVSFCALVDHELTHCAQQENEFGEPKFSKVTGLPLWRIRGHDVEEFVSVVKRFGIEAAGSDAVDMVVAAAERPTIGRAKVKQACGTCLKVAA